MSQVGICKKLNDISYDHAVSTVVGIIRVKTRLPLAVLLKCEYFLCCLLLLEDVIKSASSLSS